MKRKAFTPSLYRETKFWFGSNTDASKVWNHLIEICPNPIVNGDHINARTESPVLFDGQPLDMAWLQFWMDSEGTDTIHIR
jgi:hypothetical protein